MLGLLLLPRLPLALLVMAADAAWTERVAQNCLDDCGDDTDQVLDLLEFDERLVELLLDEREPEV